MCVRVSVWGSYASCAYCRWLYPMSSMFGEDPLDHFVGEVCIAAINGIEECTVQYSCFGARYDRIEKNVPIEYYTAREGVLE